MFSRMRRNLPPGWSKNFRAFFIRILLAFTVINFNFRLIWNLNGNVYKGCYVYKRNPKGWRLVAVAPTKTVHQHLHFSNIIPESPTVYVTQPCALYLPEALQTKLPRRGYLYGFRRSTGAIDFFRFSAKFTRFRVARYRTGKQNQGLPSEILPGGWDNENLWLEIFPIFLHRYTVWNIYHFSLPVCRSIVSKVCNLRITDRSEINYYRLYQRQNKRKNKYLQNILRRFFAQTVVNLSTTVRISLKNSTPR